MFKRWAVPNITNIYEYIGYQDDLRLLIRMNYDVNIHTEIEEMMK